MPSTVAWLPHKDIQSQLLDPNLINDNILAGDKRALARSITIVERSGPDAQRPPPAHQPPRRPFLHRRHNRPPRCRQKHPRRQAGLSTSETGPTGTAHLRRPKVGILAADPTSPFTGGAILGDRVRMQRHYKDPGVYIRSMATRGSQGGLP